MLSDQRPGSSINNNHNGSSSRNHSNSNGGDDEYEVRDIHPLTPPPGSVRSRRRETSENDSGHLASSLSVGSEALSEQFTTMSRELHALVLAMSDPAVANNDGDAAAGNAGGNSNLGRRIGEEEMPVEMNPLAIVPTDGHPLEPDSSPRRLMAVADDHAGEEVSLLRVKKEEAESKISAWQTAKIARINNRFKREDVIINGWESEQLERATALLKKTERKLEEKRARAVEKMENDVAKAVQKAEEKRASAEAKRGTKVARILEMANLLRAVGRAPSKRSFF